MVRQSTQTSPNTIADFSAGNGSLLVEGIARWPNANIVACDIDTHTVRNLKRNYPFWNISQCNFLSLTSRNQAIHIKQRLKKIDVILLNPPFSCRGGEIYKVLMNGKEILCSKALAFLIESTQYLADDGELIALLPQNTLSSEKDKKGWDYLLNNYTIRKGKTSARGAFKGCFARCVIVRLTNRKRTKKIDSTPNKSAIKNFIDINLIRGTVQMHENSKGSTTLVHTKDLQKSKVILNGHVASNSRPSVIGPAVLIPRVGQPSPSKISLYIRRKRVVLSDCVLGIQCKTKLEAEWIQNMILDDWITFRKIYTGTCANYTTLQRLRAFLNSIGCNEI